jgi:hypothetical protein
MDINSERIKCSKIPNCGDVLKRREPVAARQTWKT